MATTILPRRKRERFIKLALLLSLMASVLVVLVTLVGVSSHTEAEKQVDETEVVSTVKREFYSFVLDKPKVITSETKTTTTVTITTTVELTTAEVTASETEKKITSNSQTSTATKQTITEKNESVETSTTSIDEAMVTRDTTKCITTVETTVISESASSMVIAETEKIQTTISSKPENTGKNLVLNSEDLQTRFTLQKKYLTRQSGVYEWQSSDRGKVHETYYAWNLQGVFRQFSNEIGYTYKDVAIRSDGVRCIRRGDDERDWLVLVAMNLKKYPRGTLVRTSVGFGIVVDTAAEFKGNEIDVAVSSNHWGGTAKVFN